MRPSHYPGPITNNKVMQVTHRMPSGLSSPRWCQGPAKPPWKASMEVTSGVRNCLDHFRPLAWDFVIIYLAWVGAIQDFGWSLGDYFHDPKIWRDLVYYHISSVQVLFMTFYDCHESQVHYSNYLPNGQVPDDPISIPRSKVKTPRSEGQRRNPRYCWWVSHQLLRYQLDFAPESTVTVKVKGKSSTDDIGWCGPSTEYTCIKSRNLSTPTPPHVTSGEECGTSTPLTFASISLWSNRSPMALKWKSQMARNDPAPARRIALEASKIKYIPTPAKCKAHTNSERFVLFTDSFWCNQSERKQESRWISAWVELRPGIFPKRPVVWLELWFHLPLAQFSSASGHGTSAPFQLLRLLGADSHTS